MARPKRAEILFEPEEYERLKGIARQHGLSLPQFGTLEVALETHPMQLERLKLEFLRPEGPL